MHRKKFALALHSRDAAIGRRGPGPHSTILALAPAPDSWPLRSRVPARRAHSHCAAGIRRRHRIGNAHEPRDAHTRGKRSSGSTRTATRRSGPTRSACTRSSDIGEPGDRAVRWPQGRRGRPPARSRSGDREQDSRSRTRRRPPWRCSSSARSSAWSARWKATRSRASASPAPCVTRRSTTRSRPASGIRLDGWPNRDLEPRERSSRFPPP